MGLHAGRSRGRALGGSPLTAPLLDRPQRRDPSRRHDRVTAWAVVAFLSVLTLEWVTVTGFSGGFIKPFHLAMIGVGLIAFARWHPGRVVGPVLARHAPIYVPYIVLIALALAGGLRFATPYFPRNNGIRQLSYVGASMLLAGVLLQILPHRRVQRVLAWAGVFTAVTVAAGLTLALASQNVNPINLVQEALAKADPDIISNELLRGAFRTDEGLAEAGANLRHKVFLAVLIGTFLGLAFLPAVSRRRTVVRALLMVAGAAGSLLVVLSLSRSTILVLVIPAVLVPLRILVRRRAGTLHAVVFGLAGLVFAGLALSPLAELLYERFAATGSVEARLEGAGPIFMSLAPEAALAGTAKPSTGSSPHNLVLDAWLSGGVLASLAALLVLVFFTRVWWRIARGYLTGTGRWLLPVEPVWLLGIGFLPLVRSVTAGNQFHMVEWTAIAVFLAVVTANDRLVAAAPPLPPYSASDAPPDREAVHT